MDLFRKDVDPGTSALALVGRKDSRRVIPPANSTSLRRCRHWLPPRGKVLRGGHPEGSLEHGRKGAGATVADIECDIGHTVPDGQTGQRFHKPHVLSPGSECHSRLALEMPRKGPATHGRSASHHIQGFTLRGVCKNRPTDPLEVGMSRHRHMKRDRRRLCNLIQNQVHDPTVTSLFVVFEREDRCLNDQFAEERGNLDNPAIGWQVGTCADIYVQGANGHVTPAMHLVEDLGRYPECTLRRNNKRIRVCNNEHDASRCVKKLGPLMAMARIHMICPVLVGKRGHRTRHVLIVDPLGAPLDFVHYCRCRRIPDMCASRASSLSTNLCAHLRTL